MAKILVVDDEPYLRSDLKRATEKAGREVVEANNKNQALKLIEENDFDTVVTDLIMERSDEEQGLDVLVAAKRKDALTQVIVVTQYPTAERGVKAMVEGAFDYIERSMPGVNYLKLLSAKVDLALSYREAKQEESCEQH
jgi:DNA-binding NtrC family response regulator